MKKILYLPLFAAMLTLFGCSTEPEGIDQPKSTELTISLEVIDAIKAMGYSTEGIYVTQDAYIVEDDIRIAKVLLEETENEVPETRHNYYGEDHRINNDVLRYELSIALVELPSGATASQKAAMQKYSGQLSSAIREFNAIEGTSIKLIRHNGMSVEAMIAITCNDGIWMDQDRLVVSNIPYKGVPGNLIYINSSEGISWANVSDSQIKASLVHAIAHCLGLGHTGGYQDSGSDAGEDGFGYKETSLPGEHNDNGSIMHPDNTKYPNNNNNDGSLTEGDIDALRSMYPKYKITIKGATSVQVGQSYTYSLDDTGSFYPLPGAPNVTWKITGGEILSQYRQEVDVKIISGSIHKIEATVKVGSDPYSYVATPLILNATVPVLISGSIAPATQTIAYGATPAIFTSTANASGGEGTITYQWQKSSNKTSWTNITNAKSATYQSSALTSTTYFRRQATDGKTTLYSNIVTVNVEHPFADIKIVHFQ